MLQFLSDKKNRIALMLAAGLILIVGHYEGQPLLEYVFLPQIGMAILLGATLLVLVFRWETLKETGLGEKHVWIPLAVIAGLGVSRLFVQQDMETLAGALFMASMFGLYVVCRTYGERALSFFVPFVIVGAVSVMGEAIVTQSTGNGGVFSEYATASQFLVFGWIVAPKKYQWWLSAVVITGLFFTGAPEAVFYVVVGGAVILARRDWSEKLLLPVGVLGVLMVVCSLTGMTQVLWQRSYDMVEGSYVALTDDSLTDGEQAELLNETTNGRWFEGWRFHRDILPLGWGIHPTEHYRGIGHNILVLATDQLGPVAALAWVACIIGGIRKTKWKYAFLFIGLFGVFQPFIWTKMAPWLWAMAGSATGSQVATSYVFRGVV